MRPTLRLTLSSRDTTDESFYYPRRFYERTEDYASRKVDYVLLFVFVFTVVLLLAAFVRSFPEKPGHSDAQHLPGLAAKFQSPPPKYLFTVTRASTKRVTPRRRVPAGTTPSSAATQLPLGETPEDTAATAESLKHTDATIPAIESESIHEPPSQPWVSARPSTRFCHGIGCRQLAEELEALLDHSVDPCSDFYHHVCGKWLANHKPPKGSALVSTRTLRLRRLEHVLLEEMKSGTDDVFLGRPLEMWKTCRLKHGERDSTAAFQSILRMHGLGGFPFRDNHTRDVSVTAARVLAHSAIAALADVQITKYALRRGKPAQWVIRIGPPKTLFRDFIRMRDVNADWFHSAVERMHGLRDMVHLLKLEQALVDLAGKGMAVNNYVVQPVSALLSTRYWNWLRYLNTVFQGIFHVHSTTLVTIKGDAFHRTLVALIARFGSSSILNYLAFRVYIRYSPFLNFVEFMELALLAGARLPGWEDGDPAKEAADLRCLRALSESMPEPYAYLYWNAQLRNQRRIRDSTDALAEDVIGEVVRRAKEYLNLTSAVANRFRDELFRLRRQVFVPNWFKDRDSRAKYARRLLEKGSHSSLWSLHGAIASSVSNSFQRLNNGSFETFWRGSPLRDTPWLDFDNGCLAIPSAAVDSNLTKDAFFIRHVPRLGLDLARAAFSRLTDLDSLSKLGPPGYVAHLRLELLSSCLQKQFYGNASSSQVATREDARDLLALPVALEVFLQDAAHGSQKFRFRASRTGAYSTDRLFFYEFALDRCESYDDSYFHLRLHHGVRSPAPFFVNGPLRNFAPFAKAFGCPQGSDMVAAKACTF
ncbi:hypothetical protein V5799_009498 [Amblyomma americanum]|uniref:M13 family peptidase n=1 Tax=Amblyomma americanum TaxID=6943 RepID=A0AAQ4FA65_AMBAM